MKGPRGMSPEAAEALAIQALSFLAEDSERLTRFFSVTGLDPAGIREASTAPGFLAGVLAYIASDEALATGAKNVAVACPFCMTMLRDSISARDESVQVHDIAEVVADRLA